MDLSSGLEPSGSRQMPPEGRELFTTLAKIFTLDVLLVPGIEVQARAGCGTRRRSSMIEQEQETIHHRICPFCEACCGLEITVAEGGVKRIRGHAADVFSAGYLCPKGVALKDLHEDPDRLQKPLLKRNGRFMEATWDEAFAEIERRLSAIIAQHGKDAVALVLGNPVVHKTVLLLYVPRLGRALGTHNVY